MEQSGVEADSDYPYTSGTDGQTGSCDKPKRQHAHYYCKNSKGYTTESAIMAALHEGPLETRFNVYQDFMSYKGGVYSHTTGGLAGGHAVKMIGYGTDNGTPYWLCANSWGPSWGEQGFFRISRLDTRSAMNVGVGCTPSKKTTEDAFLA